MGRAMHQRRSSRILLESERREPREERGATEEVKREGRGSEGNSPYLTMMPSKTELSALPHSPQP
jgi:hypothetical protein